MNEETYKAIFKVEGPKTDLTKVTSDPEMVCFCNNTEVNCLKVEATHPLRVYPGETVMVNMVAAGQLDGAVPGLVRVNASSYGERTNYTLQGTDSTCTPVSFPARSCNYSDTTARYELTLFYLSSNSSPSFTIGQSKYLQVKFKKCPGGFDLNTTECRCDCHKEWEKITCSFEEMTLIRSRPAWLGLLEDGSVVYQSECPYDYCRAEEVILRLTNGSFDQDLQCSPNRSGVLCGRCVDNFSLSASSSACLDCQAHSGVYLAAYVAGTLLIGLALVLFLMVCDVTTTTGTLSSLLFYVNVFQMNSSSSFLPGRFDALTVTLSWVGLHFYVTRCLYHGLDAYVKAWLEFAFPVYLLGLVAAIVFVGRVRRLGSCMTRLFAGNVVKVLATLIELSYAGLAQAVVIAVSPISVTAYSSSSSSSLGSNDSDHTREILLWQYDGNIRYFQPKHFALFLIGMAFGILILTHTLLLLCVRPLQKHSDARCLSWVAKLKPLVDAYRPPDILKGQCRYWPGLLLLMRLLLIVVFALNGGRSSMKNNLSAVVASCLVLLSVMWSTGGVYTNFRLNLLNAFPIANLGLLCLVTLAEYKTVIMAYVSASATILVLFLVLAFHVIRRFKFLCRRCWRRSVIFMKPVEVGVGESSEENSSLLPQLREY